MDPEYVESVWWSLKQIFDKGLLVEDYRVAPYCPRCGTGLSDHELAAGLRDRRRPVGLRPVPADLRPATPARRRCWSGPPRRGPWSPTPPSPSTPTSPTSPRPTAPRRWSSPSRWSSRRSARAGRCTDRFTGREMERWTYQRPFDLVDWPDGRARRTSSCSPTTSPPRTAPGWCTSPPRSAPTTSRSAGRTACRWSTRSGPTATSRTTSGWSAAQFFKHADETLVADLDERGLLFRHVPYEHATRTAGAATRALLYYAQPSWYIRTTAVKDALLAREREDQLVPRHDQVRPVRRLAEQQHRLGAVPQPLLGHAAADLALRAEDRRTWSASARWPSSASWPGRTSPTSTRTGRTSTTSPSPAPTLRRRRHDAPGPRGHRRLVRLRLDAVRPVGLPARRGLGGAVRAAPTRRSSSARRSTRPAAGSTR